MTRRSAPAIAILVALFGAGGDVDPSEAVPPGRVRVQVSRATADGIDSDLLQQKRTSGFVSVLVLIGRLEHLSGDSLTLRGEGGESTVTIAVADAQSMEVWSQGDRGAAGAILGVLVGGVLGGLVGHSVQDEPEPANCGQLICDLDFSLSETATGVLVGAFLGGALGYALGKQIHSDRWDPVDLHRRRAGLMRSPSGAVGLGLARTF